MSSLTNHVNKDNLVALLASVMGVVAYCIPKVIASLIAPDGPFLVYLALGLTLLAPLVCGVFGRQRAWRWALYVIGGQIAFQYATEPGDTTQFPLGVALYAVLLPLAMLCGVMGAYLSGLFVIQNDSEPGNNP